MPTTPEAQARSRRRHQRYRRLWWASMLMWFAGFAVTFAVREQWLGYREAPFIFMFCFLGWVLANRAEVARWEKLAKFADDSDCA